MGRCKYLVQTRRERCNVIHEWVRCDVFEGYVLSVRGVHVSVSMVQSASDRDRWWSLWKAGAGA